MLEEEGGVNSWNYYFIHSAQQRLATITHACTLQTDLIPTFKTGSLIVQELCESRGGRPGLSVLASLLVSVDVKLY